MIYGFSLAGCLSLYCTINLLGGGAEGGLDMWKTASVLGYCLLPVVLLAGKTGRTERLHFHNSTAQHSTCWSLDHTHIFFTKSAMFDTHGFKYFNCA